MKSTELHRLVIEDGWELYRTSGSHHIYKKNGRTIVVPYHGSKEIRKGTALSILKQIRQK
ncbi:MAG: type II toxin-antitoxin system HicA family toxin [Bacteroidales bacterium]|nr:type II toxin-antitoxin system HicA family toxin [Bacteroidales bacterium]MBQ2447240.1 type II toxin-antitoxin system HicA family toxin [Bacteroidales bacterium]MBQ5604921.1 type II toxin-antitoxin system HicA family toxin [Bacteroidales bacterium]